MRIPAVLMQCIVTLSLLAACDSTSDQAACDPGTIVAPGCEADEDSPDWLPLPADGLAFTSYSSIAGEIWFVEPDGQGLVRLATIPGNGSSPDVSWSPDGSRLAIGLGGGSGIRVLRVDSAGTLESLTTDGGYAPAWSPDGSRIAYLKTGTEGRGLYVLETAEAGATPVGLLEERVREFDWSPDGSLLVAAADVLTIVEIESGAVRPLQNTVGANPAWSPDGQWIAYSHHLEDEGGSELFLVPATGGEPIRLTVTDVPGAYRNVWPEWSPDGARIAFGRYLGSGEPDLHVVDVDGSGVTDLAVGAYRFAWTADGSSIAFGGPAGLGVVSPAGGAITMFTDYGMPGTWRP